MSHRSPIISAGNQQLLPLEVIYEDHHDIRAQRHAEVTDAQTLYDRANRLRIGKIGATHFTFAEKTRMIDDAFRVVSIENMMAEYARSAREMLRELIQDAMQINTPVRDAELPKVGAWLKPEEAANLTSLSAGFVRVVSDQCVGVGFSSPEEEALYRASLGAENVTIETLRKQLVSGFHERMAQIWHKISNDV